MTRAFIWVSGALAVCVAGCGGSDSNLVTVTGTINLNGKPLSDAEVSFVPDPPDKDHQGATDITGPQGNYKLKSGEAFGIQPGRYTVYVRKAGEASSEASRLHPNDPFMAQLSTAPPNLPGFKSRNARKETDAIEEKFLDRDVSRDGGVIDFDIKAKTAAADVEDAPDKKSAKKKGRG